MVYGTPMDRKLSEVDSDVAVAIRRETERQATGLELIASENFVSEAVLEAMGSVFTNKYAEGLKVFGTGVRKAPRHRRT